MFLSKTVSIEQLAGKCEKTMPACAGAWTQKNPNQVDTA
jgi:hypothetical protein